MWCPVPLWALLNCVHKELLAAGELYSWVKHKLILQGAIRRSLYFKAIRERLGTCSVYWNNWMSPNYSMYFSRVMNVYALIADCLVGRLNQWLMKERCFNSISDLNFTSKNSLSCVGWIYHGLQTRQHCSLFSMGSFALIILHSWSGWSLFFTHYRIWLLKRKQKQFNYLPVQAILDVRFKLMTPCMQSCDVKLCNLPLIFIYSNPNCIQVRLKFVLHFFKINTLCNDINTSEQFHV